jgi:hypothetical protein
MSAYEIRELDPLGALLKIVEADNAFRAMELAFPGKEFHRETGWGGGSGTWKVKGIRPIKLVWVGPAAPRMPKVGLGIKPDPSGLKPTKRKAKAK